MACSTPRHVVFFVLPGIQAIDLVGPLEVFDSATKWLKLQAGSDPGYRCSVVGPEADSATAAGLRIHLDDPNSVRGAIDTLFIPGALDFPMRSLERRDAGWLSARADGAQRVASVCTGAFVLAELGLLRGRRATTHWLMAKALAARFPDVQVQPDAIFVQDGHVFTSAGASAGIDLALHLVERDLGHDAALAVAQLLVVFLQRPGGQSQFSAAMQTRRPSASPIQAVQAAVVDAPGGEHDVPSMARRAGMSPRHFSRVFTEQTGESPGRFVQRVRLEAARELLEHSELGLTEIAERVGAGSAESLRRGLHRGLGVSPSAYRRRFREGHASTV